MNYFELLENVEKLYPGKNAKVILDEDCIYKYEVMKTEGKFFPGVYVEHRHAKIQADGQDDVLLPMKPHRVSIPYKQFYENLPFKQDVYINPHDLDELKALANIVLKDPENSEFVKEYNDKLEMLCSQCWVSKEELKALK